jgi:RNA polymerase sigma factor (TIGR02999 family)
MTEGLGDVTLLLRRWSDGDSGALERLLPLVYETLRRLAGRHLRRERPGHTLEATALIHEAYLRLVDQDRVHWKGRSQFYGLASQMMRRILVDHARRRLAVKRGGAEARLCFDETRDSREGPVDLIALDDALRELERLDERQSRIVEFRFFGGLSVDETALALGVSPETVKRDWRAAKAWLALQLGRR